MEQSVCIHLNAITAVNVSDKGVCEECIKHQGQWVHLRTCQTCGVTLCCDSSPSRHMTAHVNQTGHPVVASAEPGERWLWCYADEEFMEY